MEKHTHVYFFTFPKSKIKVKLYLLVIDFDRLKSAEGKHVIASTYLKGKEWFLALSSDA